MKENEQMNNLYKKVVYRQVGANLRRKMKPVSYIFNEMCFGALQDLHKYMTLFLKSERVLHNFFYFFKSENLTHEKEWRCSSYQIKRKVCDISTSGDFPGVDSQVSKKLNSWHKIIQGELTCY